jgi:two-component system response regulator ChvI
LTPKAKILSDEVNIGWFRLLPALFQSVQWVVDAAKRRMFALGKDWFFRWDWGSNSRSHIAIGLLPPSPLLEGVTSRVREAATGQHGSGCFPVLSWDPDHVKRGLFAMTAVVESDAACLEAASPLETLARVGQTDGPMRVLFVEDGRHHRELLVTELSKRGFAGWGFADSASLLGALDTGVEADIILVLDGGLSKTSGIDLLALLRRRGVNLPIVFLAGRPLAEHEGLTLERGAIDFIDKTRGVDLSVARLGRAVEAAKLPAAPRPNRVMVCGKLILRPDVDRASWDGVDVGLTHGEYNIVHLLVSNVGRFVTYRAIYDRMHYEGFIAGNGGDGYRANVRSAVKRIRSKFRERDASFAEIENYNSFGYRWGKSNGAA